MSARAGEPRAFPGAGRGELRALTGARGVAAWLVVLFHLRLSIAGLPAPALAVLGKGYLAVDFFFMLSGFVISLTWQERLRTEPGAVRRFWWKRVARIWPLHLAMLAFAVALALLLAVTGRSGGGQFPPAQFPIHLLLVQDWGVTDRLAWNDPAWSISAELAAYLLFPALAALVDWRRWPTLALLAVAAGLLMLLGMIFRAAGAETLGQDITHLGVPRCIAEFVVGTILCALWERWRAVAAWRALVAGATALLLGAGVWAGSLPETFAAPAALAALLLALALTGDTPGNPLASRPLHRLGEISFATYLSHYLLFFAFKLAAVRDASAVPPGEVAAYLALVLAASVALYRLVERPAQRWVERLPASLAKASPRPRAGVHLAPGTARAPQIRRPGQR